MGAESIPMMYQGLQLDNPLDHYAKGQALSHMAAQSKLINSQIAEKEQANTLSRMRQQALAGAGGDMDRAKASLMSMGDYAGAHEIEKNQLDTQKTQADISSTNTKNQAALWDHRKQVAAFIADGGTLDHAGMAVDALVKGGDVQGAQWLHGLIQQHPNATPDQIRQAMAPIINMGISAENRSMPKYEDAGGVKRNINPFVQSPDIAKTQTPDSIASNATTIRGQNLTDAREKATETRLSTAQQRLDQQNQRDISGAQGSKALIAEMRQLVQDNPRATATPLAGPARLAESMAGVFDTGAKSGPAIRFNQLRDTLLATIDGLRKDGRMSNQDRQRLENAVGSGMTTPANTIDALNTVEGIIDRMSGNTGAGTEGNGQSGYMERRKKLLGY